MPAANCVLREPFGPRRLSLLQGGGWYNASPTNLINIILIRDPSHSISQDCARPKQICQETHKNTVHCITNSKSLPTTPEEISGMLIVMFQIRFRHLTVPKYCNAPPQGLYNVFNSARVQAYMKFKIIAQNIRYGPLS